MRLYSLEVREVAYLLSPFCPIQVLQRYRSSAGSGVYGRGHSLHHLRGSGEGPERCLEDGLRWTPRCYTSRSVQTGR